MKKHIGKISLILLLCCTFLCVSGTVSATDYAGYFKDDKKVVSAKETAEDIVLSCKKDGEVTFANVLSCKNFSLNMQMPKAGCERLRFTLTDANDSKVSLTFYVEVSSGKLVLGKEKVAFAKKGEEAEIVYNNSYRALFNGDEEKLVACDKDDAGKKFSGFTGGVYLTIGFEKVSGNCELHLNRLNNQALGHRGNNIGDLTEPMIQLTSTLNTRQYMDDEFDIPTFEAFDVYSDVVEKKVSVATPSGETMESDENGKIDSFKITEYGRYRLTYYAEDSKGNSAETIYFVNVNDDIVPILDVKSLSKKSYKKGDTVKVPSYTAEDNLGEYSVDVILVLPNSELRLLSHDENGEITSYITNNELYNESFSVSDNSFCAEQKGEYIIRYVAYDEFFNRDVVELAFTVK